MTTIHLRTEINAPIQIVFDLNRNIDIHKLSTSRSDETAIAGTTSGLINQGETVTWRGKHFGIYLTHKSLIPEMEFPNYFIDEMIKKSNTKRITCEHIVEKLIKKDLMKKDSLGNLIYNDSLKELIYEIFVLTDDDKKEKMEFIYEID